MDRLLDGALGQAEMHRLQAKLAKLGIKKEHLVLGSESCHCPTTAYAGGSNEIAFARAERYVHTILADLAAGSHGWLEWNLILDGIGGPNHLGNLCESGILSVPHRALDADPEMPSLPYFEPLKPMGNVSFGEGRTREELNALGIPAKLLDIGIVVQPIYFYTGHISRHVRPGSQAVMGLVNAASGEHKIFRPKGQVVAGGGENNLARNGIELTAWPCEGSTRQIFKWNDKTLQIRVFGHDWLGKPTTSCISRIVDKDFRSLRLTDCDDTLGTPGEFVFRDLGNSTYNIILDSRGSTRRGDCVVIQELQNNGGAYGPRGGAQVTLGDCSRGSAAWIIDRETGEASSAYFKEGDNANFVCMTTGWPFLQVGAFLTPNGASEKTVVILNEANQAANYALQDENGVLITGSMPPRSIQTVLIT
jgi:glucosylceramidase